MQPRNVGELDPQAQDVGTGTMGTLVSGDVIKLQLKINSQRIIIDTKFKAQAAVTVIAVCSWLTEWLQGKSLAAVAELQSTDIITTLNLPSVKVHSALLVADAVKFAIADWQQKNS
jgi:nitrogen fixation protein NifU and related proteins